MKRYFCCILLICIVFNLVEGFAGKELRERVYVQTDKQLYLAGEPVLMKLLTVDAGQIPLVFSKVVYVELADDSIARLQTKIEMINGTGVGRMLLPTDLPTGYYRLIAYTQFMRNEGTDVFFEKNIAIVNTFKSGYYPPETEVQPLPDINNVTQPETISLQPDKATYTTRASGKLTVTGLPENIHTLSVSIAGKELLPIIESDVSLFLKNRTRKTVADRRAEFLPEYEGHIITGKIINNQTGEIGMDDLLLAPGIAFPAGGGIRFFAGQTDKTGDVRFFTSGISGTKEIATVVYNAGEKYRVDIQSPFVRRFTPAPMPALHIDSAYYGRLLARSVALQVFRYFSENQSPSLNISESYFKMRPVWSYPLDEYTRFTTMREVFIEFIVGARFRRNADKHELLVLTKRGGDYDYGTMPLVLLDGVPISDHEAVYNYDPISVERINIYYGPCMMGGYLFDGIVELLTYSRFHADLNLNKSMQILTYEGPQSSHRLDAPDHSDMKNHQSRLPDRRHTLLWNPDVQVDGKTSIRLPFDTSDLTGEFQATVEGITKDGEIIYATSFFTVERLLY